MGLESHLVELSDKHRKLEEDLHNELLRPHPDDFRVMELKKRKLRIKEELERLRHDDDLDIPVMKAS
ncbi:MAG TPA: DUF465 domain-containing protein [Alphaproteobacteria bacterium]|nr:DUF465 domain-containing protein [Alphaproteobacteria bacterium]HAJ47360.1 DUF465 domain-containing protein [Alphaproteobacteria bacterium]